MNKKTRTKMRKWYLIRTHQIGNFISEVNPVNPASQGESVKLADEQLKMGQHFVERHNQLVDAYENLAEAYSRISAIHGQLREQAGYTDHQGEAGPEGVRGVDGEPSRSSAEQVDTHHSLKIDGFETTAKQLLERALADLEGVMPEFEPGGDRTHPGWQTIKEIKSALRQWSVEQVDGALDEDDDTDEDDDEDEDEDDEDDEDEDLPDGPTLDDLQDKLRNKPSQVLEDALVDIALRLSYDEWNRYNPEESVAADSAADFVDSVKHTFEKSLGIEL